MALVTSDLGEIQLLTKMLQATLSVDENYILKLYSNNVTPDNTFITTSLTEASFTNYAAKTLARASWSTPTTISGAATSTYATQSWTCGASGQTVYGYWVQGATSGTLLWAEKFATSRTLATGDILNVSLSFSLNSAN